MESQKSLSQMSPQAPERFQDRVSLFNRSGQRGFTVIEIIIVMTLIVTVMGVSAVYYANTLPKFRLNAATREVTAEMRKARALARIQNEKQTVNFDLDKKTFGISGRKTLELPEGISMKIIHPVQGEIRKGLTTITFYPTGGSEGYSVVLSSERSLQMIQMDPVVGATVVQQNEK